MSFSTDVKDEISKHTANARHCQIAEATAMLYMVGNVKKYYKEHNAIFIRSENEAVIRRFCILIKKILGISLEVRVKHTINKGHIYETVIYNAKEYTNTLSTLKLKEEYDGSGSLTGHFVFDNIVIQKECCKRAFIKGAFLTSGSVNNPEKAYHFEIVCFDKKSSDVVKNVINSFDIDSKVVIRKKYYVVYIKEGSMIVDILSVMEAHVSLMHMENVRILKEVRNSINRQVNCDYANINKTVNAAQKQLDDIKYIEQTKGFESLSDSLREMAELRLAEPEASLKELGEMLNPPVGKSGVNHRLRKLSSIANDMRDENYDH